MMLKTTKQITLMGNCLINDQPVMQLTATFPSDTGIATVNQYVQNAALYDANKVQIRSDVAAFNEEVYAIEDELAAERALLEPEPGV